MSEIEIKSCPGYQNNTNSEPRKPGDDEFVDLKKHNSEPSSEPRKPGDDEFVDLGGR